MAVFKERNTSRAGYWIAGEALEKSWLPAYFAPEFKELDDLPKKSGDEYVLLDKLVRLHQAIPSKTATAKADWLIVDRKGTMVTELFHGELGGETVQVVPNDSLVISPFFSDRLSVCYWEEEIFRGRAVTSARNIVLVPAGSRPIAWLAAELNSRICSLQLRRITAGTAAQEIDPEALLDILVPGHSKKTLANLVKKVRRGSFRDAEQARRSLFSADLRSNLQPLILTGATFEERIRQFENYLLEHKIVSVGDAFFVEASSRGKDSGNFVVRPVGRFGQGDFGPASNWLQPQEDLEELRAWNNWYWDTDPKTRVAIFNTLLREDALPGTLLAKTLANPWSPRSPFSGPRVLPSFYNYRAALRQIIFRDEIDLKNFYDEVSSLWMRHNQKDDLTEKIVNWFRKIYRPVAAVKVMRDGKVAGAYLLFGKDQWLRPEEAAGELEALALVVSEILGRPSDIADDVVKKESIRRLSWMMHQISGPLMRIDGVIQDIEQMIVIRPELADELIPSPRDAEQRAAMNDTHLSCYTLANRLQDISEAAESIRRLKKQVQDLKNAQKDPVYLKVNIRRVLTDLCEGIEHDVHGLVSHIQCNDTLEVMLDESAISEALREVLGNALREFRERGVDTPQIIFTAKSDGTLLTVTVTDNAFPADEELISKPFDEDATTYSRTGQGTGLGLTIVKEIIHRHGGVCSLEANTDASGNRIPGVTFRAELPLISSKDDEENNHEV